MGGRSLSLQTQLVLRALIEDPTRQHYGLEIGKAAGLPSGSLYPILARLEGQGVLESEWEQVDPREVGRKPRRYYRLTPHGAALARSELAATRERLRLPLTEPAGGPRGLGWSSA